MAALATAGVDSAKSVGQGLKLLETVSADTGLPLHTQQVCRISPAAMLRWYCCQVQLYVARASQEVGSEKALSQLRALVEQFPESILPRIVLAKRLEDAGELDSGADALSVALPGSEASSAWQTTLGRLRLKGGNPTEALEILTRACELAPDSAECHLWRAKVRFNRMLTAALNLLCRQCGLWVGI